MDTREVNEYIERSQSLIESSPQMDEQNTRSRLIDPFLQDVLGWDFYSTDVELEYSVQMGSTKKKVDYALLVDDAPAIFVEAKGCDTALNGSHGDQLTSYMRQEWVDWGLLTNVKQFKLYKLQKKADTPEVELLGDLSLDSLEPNHWMLKALSKESIESGDAHTIYQNVNRRRRAVETLSEVKDEIAGDVRELLVERAGDVVSQPAESLSKQIVDELIDELQGDDNKRDVRSDSTAIDSNPEPSQNPSTDDYSVTIRGSDESITFADDTQNKLMATVADYLIQNHQLIDRLPEFPYVPGRKSAMLSHEPYHPNGEEMRSYERLTDDYYLYTSLNKESKQRQIRRFAEFCGVSVAFSGEW